MKNFKEFNSDIQFVLTDIDDTLTTEGQLQPEAFEALWNLHRAGFKVIPITGRPAGWCELIARFWPVEAVVGENGGFYFRYDHRNKKMLRWYAQDSKTREENRTKLEQIKLEILQKITGSAIASDQFCREIDLAIDFCEDVPRLKNDEINQIVQIFEKHGATAKVSSIHVNGWFGQHDKLTTTLQLLKDIWNYDQLKAQKKSIFVGDSPNDEPMFKFFENSFAVANIQPFLNQLQHKPHFIMTYVGGQGFQQLTKHLIENKKT